MRYTQKTPCKECPFLKSMRNGFTIGRLKEFASGEFPCHKSSELNEDNEYERTENSVHCAGALIFNEKRNSPHQMARISERLGMYDYTKLDMKADVR
jgi:hypothetical protein